MMGRKAVKVTDKELNDIKQFFSENYGAKTECEEGGGITMATLWRFLQTGRARPEKIKRIRQFIKDYQPEMI